jgi:hypothetical protein
MRFAEQLRNLIGLVFVDMQDQASDLPVLLAVFDRPACPVLAAILPDTIMVLDIISLKL